MATDGATSKAAVVFADISGSTQLYVQHGDAAARNIIAKALDYLIGVTKDHRGVVIKTIGDEVMCRFGSADDAFDAAVGMQRSLNAFTKGPHSGPDIEYLLRLMQDGKLQVDVGWRGSWTRIGEAADALMGRRVSGKAVLDVD